MADQLNGRYDPQANLDDVDLPEELLSLSEELAANGHDNWARARIKQGWHYGKQLSKKNKTHPGLRPYDELSDGEKEIDRQVAMATLKFIVKQGYKIVKDEHGA